MIDTTKIGCTVYMGYQKLIKGKTKDPLAWKVVP